MGYLTLACLMNMYRVWRAYINSLYTNCLRSLKFARFEVLAVVLLNIKSFLGSDTNMVSHPRRLGSSNMKFVLQFIIIKIIL